MPIFVDSSFLSALSFFSSGLQNVLIEFIDELNLDSLASSCKKSMFDFVLIKMFSYSIPTEMFPLSLVRDLKNP